MLPIVGEISTLQLLVYLMLGSIALELIIFMLLVKIASKAGMSKQDIVNTIWSIGTMILSLLRFLNDKGIITTDEYLRMSALFLLIFRRPDLSEKLMLYILHNPDILRGGAR